MLKTEMLEQIESGAIYRSRRWRKFRQSVMARDEYQCQECKRYGRIKQAETVHHIKHADEAPELFYDMSNCVRVCKDCHNKLHPEKGGRYY